MAPLVATSYGKLRGTEERAVTVFRGIPFARPPVGPLRFRAPERPAGWAGVRDAIRFGPAAPQQASTLGPALSMGLAETSEDCLYLNIWTPAPDGLRRPVLAWIHGGGFILGAGSQTLYDGSVLARRGDVVVVTINYRLGALGFLRLRELGGDHAAASGNEGLLGLLAGLYAPRAPSRPGAVPPVAPGPPILQDARYGCRARARPRAPMGGAPPRWTTPGRGRRARCHDPARPAPVRAGAGRRGAAARPPRGDRGRAFQGRCPPGGDDAGRGQALRADGSGDGEPRRGSASRPL